MTGVNPESILDASCGRANQIGSLGCAIYTPPARLVNWHKIKFLLAPAAKIGVRARVNLPPAEEEEEENSISN